MESNRFFWNSGIFLFGAEAMLRLFATHAPEILSACQRALDAVIEDLNFLVLGDQYSQAQSISLDYAIVEKAGEYWLCSTQYILERRRLMVGAVELP